MKFHLHKMPVELIDGTPHYSLIDKEGNRVSANELIGKQIEFKYLGEINCVKCGRKTKTSFGQGFCFPCFKTAPEAAECIIKPELCRAHLGEGRDPEWEQKNHNQPHYVYLALSSAVKVGITRGTNIPNRWIDQGATQGIIIAEVPYRQLAGEIEVALKDVYTDKTNWQRMLKNEVAEGVDLVEEKWSLESVLPDDLLEYFVENDDVLTIDYPVTNYPTKVKSIKLDKNPEFELKLAGIKGQYFIFESGHVINIRSHSGYQVEINI